MPHAQLNGISIYYEDAGSGFPVLLTHGYGSNAEAWRPQVEELRDRWRVVTWDVRGHGRTESPTDQSQYSEAHVLSDMTSLLGHLGIGRAVIGGLSMGGYLSMSFGLMRPDLVEALIICDTGPGNRKPDSRAAWNESALERAATLEREGFSALSQSAEVQTVLAEHRSAEGLARAARGLVYQSHSGVLGRLGAIEVPTLVIVGQNDEPFHAGISYIASHIPGARRVDIPNAGHASNLDNPKAFNNAVVEFLSEVAPSSDR